MKVEETTVVILDDEKFKKTSGSNKGDTSVTNLSHNRSNLYKNNSRSKSSSKLWVDLINKEYSCCNEIGHT